MMDIQNFKANGIVFESRVYIEIRSTMISGAVIGTYGHYLMGK